MLTRAAFAPLASEFTSTGEVQPETLLETTVAYLNGATAEGFDVALTDALVPFVPSLMGWGYGEQEIAGFLRGLAARLLAADPVVVYLDDDPSVTVARAVQREGPAWQDWLVDKLAGYPVEPPVRDLRAAVDYLRYEREATLRLLADLPWPVIVINPSAVAGADEVHRLACEQLALHLGR